MLISVSVVSSNVTCSLAVTIPSLSDLSRGSDSSPDAKVDHEPDQAQRADQLPSQSADACQSVGDHQHSTPIPDVIKKVPVSNEKYLDNEIETPTLPPPVSVLADSLPVLLDGIGEAGRLVKGAVDVVEGGVVERRDDGAEVEPGVGADARLRVPPVAAAAPRNLCTDHHQSHQTSTSDGTSTLPLVNEAKK